MTTEGRGGFGHTDGSPVHVRPARGAWRLTRGLTLALSCTLVACAGHVAGGGGAPSLPALLTVAALLGSGFVVLADRRRGFGQILCAALAAQPVFHLAFSLTGHASPGAGWRAEDPAWPAASSSGPLPAGAPWWAEPDLPMVAGHVVAAGVVSWLVSDAENVLWALVGLFARFRVPRPTVSPMGRLRLVPYTGGPDITLQRARFLALLHARRGPPG